MENLPKVIKAEMLPGVRLRLEFDRSEERRVGKECRL